MICDNSTMGGMSAGYYTGGMTNGSAVTFGPAGASFQNTSEASALEALLSGQLGPITSEGLFLVMCDMMEQQNLKIAQKTQEFREQTALQQKYADFANWMQAAQSAATGGGGKVLDESELGTMLAGMGYVEPYLTEMKEKLLDGAKTLTPSELAENLNVEIFGADNKHLYVHLDPAVKEDGEYVSGSFQQDQFNAVTEKIDAAQKKNCKDTTLLTTELNQLISHQERISNMFSNMLKKFHDTEMAIIRNI